ncbi:WXG100 family type VII secretion target [Micromonospora fluostatini]|uniref:WXG100 family type VII secretion target n=1 Tax=Micromonospora sp. JCM 30529 TaxID=3421643 RepID=UPI003D16EF7A
MSEYTQRYEPVSHQQLYDGVRAGDPEQIEGLATGWSTMRDTLNDLSRSLDGDLEGLAGTWSGAAGQEFQRRLTLIVRYAETLAEGMADVRQGLSTMSGQLRTAKQDAESPEETDDHDKAISGAAKGAIFGLPGAAIGGFLGHQQDKAEREKAHQRMVQLVAGLAASYDLTAATQLVTPPVPPTDLPGGVDGDRPTPRGGPGVQTPTAAPTTGLAGPGATATTGPGTTAHGFESTGTTGSGGGGVTTGGTTPVTAFDPTGPGSSLAGAGASPDGTVLAGTTPGTGAPGAGSGSGLLLGAGAVAAGGVLGTGALAGSGRAPVTPAARPAGAVAGLDNRSAMGTGRLAGGRAGAEGGAHRPGATGNSPAHRSGMVGGTANRAGVLGGRGSGDQEDPDGRLTWLTEDEMVWQDARSTAPAVLDGN